MAKYRVVLTAHDVDGCPMYEKEDRIILSLPDVDMEATGKVCAFVIAKPLNKRVQGGKNLICEQQENFPNKQSYLDEFGIEEGILRCPRVICEVTFSVDVQERVDELLLLQQQQFTGRMDKRSLIAKLKKIPILSAVKPDDLFDILPELKVKKCQGGETILKKGQVGRHFFIIYQGEVEVIQVYNEEKDSVIGKLKAGDCFGEMSLLTGEPVSATIRAACPSSIIMLGRTTFRELMGKNPVMGLMFTKLLAQRIKSTNQRMSMVVASGMAGQLTTIRFPELIQTLSATDCQGVLLLNKQGSQANVYFQNGEIVDATIGEASGVDCFFELLKWEQGDFRFEQKEIQRERTIFADPMGLLLEGMRRLDEETKQFHPDDLPL